LHGEPRRAIAPPDHNGKALLFALPGAEAKIGVSLSESFAMWPARQSVWGLYLVHSNSLISASPSSSATKWWIAPRARARRWRRSNAKLGSILNYAPVPFAE
jgi:5-methyltetrahydrofolate--homocysteine methyltransferase